MKYTQSQAKRMHELLSVMADGGAGVGVAPEVLDEVYELLKQLESENE